MKKIENICPICNGELKWLESNASTYIDYKNYMSIYKCNVCNKIWKVAIRAYKQNIIEKILNKDKNYHFVIIDNDTEIEYKREYKITTHN